MCSINKTLVIVEVLAIRYLFQKMHFLFYIFTAVEETPNLNINQCYTYKNVREIIRCFN